MASVGLVFRDEALRHNTGFGHPESSERLRAILNAFQQAGIDPPRVDVAPATRKELLRVHSEYHVDTIERVCAQHLPYPDPDTVMGNGSWEAALLAAGGAIAACQAVLEKRYDRVFMAMRPPGHHAERDWAMGFCLFNNIAIAARWLRDEAGLARVAILDWDIHHGNGTQHAFYDDDSVYYASIHQHPHYPGTGFPDERGKNNTNLNVQMPPGIGPDEWIRALDQYILPEFERFDPDFLLISSGFDAHARDPLGHQLLETEHYAEMTRRVRGVADGRIVSLLEGGYHLEALGESVVAHFRSLEEDGPAAAERGKQ
ncbi:MAG TPA: histone deacetylase [Candidatus Hydrogenedentes bacterium]|nr:histone deacetylase [Candidatus Hydrogenedentota bacterium]HNT86415.1 histone deacetylase [Candidatus Hydrogenedentota bacterium]